MTNWHKGIVGRFSNREAAGRALDNLVLAGFPLAQMYVLGSIPFGEQDSCSKWNLSTDVKELLHQRSLWEVLYTPVTLAHALVAGWVVGSISGPILGLAALFLPGFGQLLWGSALSLILLSSSICTIAGLAIGALINRGAIIRQAQECALEIARGNYILLVAGTEAEIFWAEHILSLGRLQ